MIESLLVLAAVAAQDPDSRDDEDVWREFLAQLKQEGIELSVDKREVSVRGAFLRHEPSPEYPIEYALIAEGGAKHEGLAVAICTPSLLNTCLLRIGLQRAQGRQFIQKEPLPSREVAEVTSRNITRLLGLEHLMGSP